jgi:hypothetical protein
MIAVVRQIVPADRLVRSRKSPYVVHHYYSSWINHETPDGIDTESRWTGRHVEDWMPEPVAGLGLNSIGNSYSSSRMLIVTVARLHGLSQA